MGPSFKRMAAPYPLGALFRVTVDGGSHLFYSNLYIIDGKFQKHVLALLAQARRINILIMTQF